MQAISSLGVRSPWIYYQYLKNRKSINLHIVNKKFAHNICATIMNNMSHKDRMKSRRALFTIVYFCQWRGLTKNWPSWSWEFLHAILIYICFEERLVTHHHTATNLLLHNESFVDFQSGLTKGGLISDVILTLVSLPTKGVKSLFWTENLNVLPITYSIFYSEEWFGTFCWQWNQSQNIFWN